MGHRPFGNDDAANFAGDLDDLDETAHHMAIRRALTEAAEGTGYLQADIAAIAVASLVAAQRLGAEPINPNYGPEHPPLSLLDDLRAVAVHALARVVADDSELKDLWDESRDRQPWLDQITQLHQTLSL
jgi:hypothetical protein